ncbi:MAG: hypothetical protein ACON3Z_18535 [Bradymonadia bacterium]
MKKTNQLLALSIVAFAAYACGDDKSNTSDMMDEPTSVTWDEGNVDQGQLSGDLSAPTVITLRAGDNHIVGTSVPAEEEQCIETPDGGQAPYYPNHESYTDTFTFTLAEGQTLTSILIEELTVEAVHSACGAPLEQQLGAFIGFSNSAQIDWDSDTFENFVKLPETYPLIGAAFAKNAGDDLLSAFKAGFSFGPYMVPALAENPGPGTYTFWWKEGANRTAYRLNFVVAAE